MTSWTNSSVLGFSKGRDPISAMLDHSQRIVFEAIEAGWTGPPFDPIALADFLKIKIVPSADVKDARTVPVGSSRHGLRIEFNPNRQRRRVRYSIAHEIAHTFFPDCIERVRYRGGHSTVSNDDWQLETLCNLAAAEILMPVAPIRHDVKDDIGVEDVLQLAKQYEASVEAILIRVCHLSQRPMVVFVASRHGPGSRNKYSMDYSVPSRAWSVPIPHGYRLPEESAVSECTAIGFTAKRRERWRGISKPVTAEFVGLPPYPGSTKPRVAGLATPAEYHAAVGATLEYYRGDALSPRGEGPKLIAHIVNDRTPNWGGGGFAATVKRRHPEIQREFRDWAKENPENFILGAVHSATVSEEVSCVQMVAQAGYGSSTKPRIRYQPLQKCLEQVADLALSLHASVHMPRIGMGHARGQWPVIEDLIYESLVSRGVFVNIYDLPLQAGTDDLHMQNCLPLR